MKKSEMFDEIVRLMKKHKKLMLKSLTHRDLSYSLLEFKMGIKEAQEEENE